MPLATERAGGLAWEYLFPFDGQEPPWVSSLAQGTGLQAMARSATRLERQAEIFPIALRGLGIFQTPPPQGVRVASAPARTTCSTRACRALRSSTASSSRSSGSTTSPR